MLQFKKWNVFKSENYMEIAAKYSINSLAAKVAASRLTILNEEELFSQNDFLSSPFDLTDMDKAVETINNAIDMGKNITVYGDYDADGITATVILYSYLEAMGANVSFYIPDRESEGYGLNTEAIQKLSDDGCELIVTVDNGIAAVEEIEYAKELGMDVVVTDHHMPQHILPECVCVDPHRDDDTSEFKEICGAFVAFKLVAALDGGEYDGAFLQYAELVAIATLADIVPLISENRTIVKFGLERIKQTDNIGLRTLMDNAFSANGDINSVSVAFGIVPRINAAGRMGNACRAAQLLLTEDESEAYELCNDICLDNDKRKQIESEILEKIEVILSNNPSLQTDRVLIISSKGWHHGVLGIVASKIVEKIGKPTIILSEENGVATGSGRSVEGFDLFEALCSCKNLFQRFGGHNLAAGVTIDACKVDILRRQINDYAEDKYQFMPQKTVNVDAVITAEEINLASVNELSIFEPIGKDNPSPVFVMQNLRLEKILSIANGKHSRLMFGIGSVNFYAVFFGKTPDELSPFSEKSVDILVKLKKNVYEGKESVSIVIEDIRPSNLNDDLFFNEKQLFELTVRGETLSLKQAQYVMPTREEAAEIYRFIKSSLRFNRGIDILWWQLGGKINRAKVAVIVEAFCQSGLMEIQNGSICPIKTENKIDLFSCDILKHISSFVK